MRCTGADDSRSAAVAHRRRAGTGTYQRPEEGRPRRDGVLRPLAPGLRLAVVGQGLVLLAAGAVLFVGGWGWHHGRSRIGIWPWAVTPLSAQVLGAWLIAFGIGAGLVLAERDLSRLRVPAIAYTAFGAFQLVALLANGSSMTGTRWGYGLVLAVVLATGAHGWWTTGRSGPVAYDRPGPPSTTAGRTGRGS